ncbi:regulatory protein RecX [Roseateles sp. UC29_93]|uniref:regulatory protein RecX n=1 Tax=Roseateles sp. UC29_93 TaxID=3350177 RepID=UPI00366F154B
MTPPDGRRGRASQPLSLKARAIALLAQREHSAMELRRKLLRIARDRQAEASEASEPRGDEFADEAGSKGLDDEVDAVLDWLKANAYLDESRFVESRIHVRSQRFGQRRIEQELAQHGLALDAEQRSTLVAGELDRACELLRHKFGDGPALDAAALAKRLRFLIGRGFGSDLARRAVRRVAEENDADA